MQSHLRRLAALHRQPTRPRHSRPSRGGCPTPPACTPAGRTQPRCALRAGGQARGKRWARRRHRPGAATSPLLLSLPPTPTPKPMLPAPPTDVRLVHQRVHDGCRQAAISHGQQAVQRGELLRRLLAQRDRVLRRVKVGHIHRRLEVLACGRVGVGVWRRGRTAVRWGPAAAARCKRGMPATHAKAPACAPALRRRPRTHPQSSAGSWNAAGGYRPCCGRSRPPAVSPSLPPPPVQTGCPAAPGGGQWGRWAAG